MIVVSRHDGHPSSSRLNCCRTLGITESLQFGKNLPNSIVTNLVKIAHIKKIGGEGGGSSIFGLLWLKGGWHNVTKENQRSVPCFSVLRLWRCRTWIGLSGLPHDLERRRHRHPHPEASQGRVCEAAVESTGLEVPWLAHLYVLVKAGTASGLKETF